MALIEVKDIQKSYGHRQVLTDISFDGNQGDCIGIVGANGCGKSTLLKILSGALRPTAGTITYNGETPLTHSKIFSRYIGYVPQENPLFDNLTVRDNLKLWYCDSTHSLKKDIKEGLIAEFGIDRYLGYRVSQLSGGMKKRLSIACSIAKDPQLLILDEPGASLDIVFKNDIKNYMSRYIASGGTIIIASHEEGELSVCNHMYLMNEGRLTALKEHSTITDIMERMTADNG